MKIFCIGRNYTLHAKEMGSEVPEVPVVFMKPPTALLINNKPFYIPDFSDEIHYEAEVVLRVAKNGRHVLREFAESYIDAVGFGIDFTARDLQRYCKEHGQPWEIAKGFDHSAAVSRFIPVEDVNVNNVEIRLEKNGETVQQANTTDLIFDVVDIVTYISKFFKLQTGDLIFTGTPEGVGSVAIGDQLHGYLNDQEMLSCEIR